MIQGSQAWIDARIGRVTASRVGDVFTQPRKGSLVSKVREAYLADLLAERLTGKPSVPSYAFGDNGDAISWGAQTEPFARAAYEEKTGNKIKLAGFISHPLVPMSGASPDGIVGDIYGPASALGGDEIKCPNTTTHLETVRKGIVPSKHLAQIKWNMACVGASWWDFVSFDPRAEGEQFFFRRVEADPAELREMELGVFAFVLELEARVAAHQWREAEYAAAE